MGLGLLPLSKTGQDLWKFGTGKFTAHGWAGRQKIPAFLEIRLFFFFQLLFLLSLCKVGWVGSVGNVAWDGFGFIKMEGLNLTSTLGEMNELIDGMAGWALRDELHSIDEQKDSF